MTGDPASASRSDVRRALVRLTQSAACESALMILHALYGAHRYETPALYHVLLPSLLWLVPAAALAAAYARRPATVTRWLLVALVGVPYIGIFGLVHGAIGHGAKLIVYAAGTTPERLAEMFDWADFVVPDDAFFEITGVGTFLAALVVGYLLLRFMHVTGRTPEAIGTPFRATPAPPKEG